jgi:hypothetical protein
MKEPRIIVYEGEIAVMVPLGPSVDAADLFALLGTLPSRPQIPDQVSVLPALAGPPLSCPDCGKPFKGEQGLKVHQGQMHKKATADAVGDAPALTKESSRVYTDGRGSCEVCGNDWAGHPRCTVCNGLIGKGHPGGVAGPRVRCARCITGVPV